MAKDLIDLIADSIVDSIFDDAWVGRHGEKLTARELKKASARGFEGRVLRNAYIPKENGETSEIDVLYLTEKGVFVIESKNYSGWIFGNEKDQKWTQSLQNGQKNRFYNPIRQNRGHVRWLHNYLGEDVPMFSIVVFSERCELKKITVTSSDVAVIKRPDLQKTIRRIWESAPTCMDERQVDELYEKLEPLTHAKRSTKKAHVEDIREQQEEMEARKEQRQRERERQVETAATATAEAAVATKAAAETAMATKTTTAAEATAAESAAATSDQPHMQIAGAASGETERALAAGESPAPAQPEAEATAATQTQAVATAPVAGAPTTSAAMAATADEEKPSPAVEQAANAPAALSSDDPDPLICPRCGGRLVLRTAKRGAYAGNQFLGCSNYPHCRYIRNL